MGFREMKIQIKKDFHGLLRIIYYDLEYMINTVIYTQGILV